MAHIMPVCQGQKLFLSTFTSCLISLLPYIFLLQRVLLNNIFPVFYLEVNVWCGCLCQQGTGADDSGGPALCVWFHRFMALAKKRNLSESQVSLQQLRKWQDQAQQEVSAPYRWITSYSKTNIASLSTLSPRFFFAISIFPQDFLGIYYSSVI